MQSLSQISIADVFTSILKCVRKHRVMIEARFTALVVGIFVVEGLGRQLDPHVDLFSKCAPWLLRYANVNSL